MSQERSTYPPRLIVEQSRTRRKATTGDPDRSLFPPIDPIDYPRHNPWDGEFLSDDTLTMMLWLHKGRRPHPSELVDWKRLRGYIRYRFINHYEIKRPENPTPYPYVHDCDAEPPEPAES